jgi:hypothetical protein
VTPGQQGENAWRRNDGWTFAELAFISNGCRPLAEQLRREREGRSL